MADETKQEELKKEEKTDNNKEEQKEESAVKDELTKLKEQLADINDKYLRALAEMDNLRKRTAREKEEFMKYAKAEIAREFLPIYDNLERASATASKTNDFKALKEGVDMVVKQFMGIIEKMGMTPVEEEGHFDPEKHFVVHKEEHPEKEEGHIIETYQKGYMMDGRVVRHAMVKVAAGPKSKKQSESEEDKNKTNGGDK